MHTASYSTSETYSLSSCEKVTFSLSEPTKSALDFNIDGSYHHEFKHHYTDRESVAAETGEVF